MKLINLFKKFRGEEDGAVTVDWVVLTAAVVGLGIIAMTLIGPAINNMSGVIASNISSASSVPTT